MSRWLYRIAFGPDRLAPLDFGAELWKWDVNVYESVDAIRQSDIWQSRIQLRSGRTLDDDDLLGEATRTLVRDVVNAVGGMEAAHARLVASLAQAQADHEQVASQRGNSSDSEEPELILSSPGPLEHAWYALEEMIIWARTFDDRLSRPAQGNYPKQGLIPALADGPRRDAVEAARSRLTNAYLKEVRYLAGLNLHRQSTNAGSATARVRGGHLLLPFPDRVNGRLSHRWQLTYNEDRDGRSYADGLLSAVERFMDEMLSAFEEHLPERFKRVLPQGAGRSDVGREE